MRRSPFLVAAVLVVAPVTLAACGDDHAHDPDHVDAAPAIDAPTTQPVTLAFAAEVGGAAFACGQSYSGIGTTSATYVGTDFRFYVHDVRLTGPGGGATPCLHPLSAYRGDSRGCVAACAGRVTKP